MAKKQDKVFLESIFDTIPSLPKGLMLFLVAIVPYIIVIGLVLAAISVIRLIFSFLQGGLAGMGAFFQFTGLAGILLFVQLMFYLYISYLGYKALPDLFARRLSGWMVMYKVQIYSTIFNLCMFFLSTGLFSSFFARVPGLLLQTFISGLIFQCIGIFIGFYLVFKMKPHYK